MSNIIGTMFEPKAILAFLLAALLIGCAHSMPLVSRPSAELYRAAGKGNVGELAKANDYQINGSNELGTTLLMVAARRNSEPSVNYLLARGASAKALDMHNQTPLHYSLPNHNPQIDEALIKAGADPSVIDKFGVAPALMWAEQGMFDTLLLSLEQRDKWCCYQEIKDDLHKILNAESKEKSYLPPSLFIVIKELE